MVGIYKITNQFGQVYIGQSVDVRRRIVDHKNVNQWYRYNNKLYNSFRENGIENHIFELIALCPLQELDNKERHYQELYDSIENGLNTQYTKTKDKPCFLTEYHKSLFRNAKRKVKEKIIKTPKKRESKKRKSENKIVVLDINTGVFYNTITDASNHSQYKFSVLNRMLRGFKPNISQYRIV